MSDFVLTRRQFLFMVASGTLAVGTHPRANAEQPDGREFTPSGRPKPHVYVGTLGQAHGIEGSMSRKGDCWEREACPPGYNAVVESFFGSLKSERVHWRNHQSRDQARADIVEYTGMFYNRRFHS